MTPRSDLSTLRFDDIQAGDRFPLGEHLMTREDVIAFAEKYDPQPYHLDDAAVIDHPVFERLSASGWHTVMVTQLLLDRFWKGTPVRGLAGLGVDDIRWIRPVYPGDVLRAELAIVACRRSKSRPERGIITMRVTAQNAAGEDVITLSMGGIFAAD